MTGWNLLGNSSAAPINVATTFGDSSKITTVWKWSKTSSKWAFYTPAMSSADLATYTTSKGYDVLTSIASKEGFWVNAASTAAISGPTAAGVTLTEGDLAKGWNLVGSADSKTPAQLNQSFNNSLSTAGKGIVTTWAWDAPTAKWKFYAPSLATQGGTALNDYIGSNGYLPPTTISSTEGIWINVQSAVAVAVDPCAVTHNNYGEIVYPPSYVGAFPIPVPSQKLPSTVGRNVSFKDYNPSNALNYKNKPAGCTDAVAYGRNLYKETLDRMQAAGVESTWIYNYMNWVDIDQPTLILATPGMPSKSGSAAWSVPLSEMKFIVEEAAKRNIKVFLEIQVIKCDIQWKCLPEDPTNTMGASMSDADYNKVVQGAHTEIVQQAAVAQQAGIAGMLIDGSIYWMNGIQGARRESYINDIVSRIADVRQVFSGKLFYKGDISPLDARITSKIDSLMLTIMNPTLTEDQTKNLSISSMKDLMLTQINDKYRWNVNESNGVASNIPILWTIFVQSNYDTFITGFTEDGYCVSNCIQLTYKTDFSTQAIGIEAALEAIVAQTHYKNDIVHIMSGYWLTDDIEPTEWDSSACGTPSGTCDNVRSGNNFDFPNLSESIRNKPAEGIVKYWFGR